MAGTMAWGCGTESTRSNPEGSNGMLVQHLPLLSVGPLVGPPLVGLSFNQMNVTVIMIVVRAMICRPGGKSNNDMILCPALCWWCSGLLPWTEFQIVDLAWLNLPALSSAVQHALHCCCRAVALPA